MDASIRQPAESVARCAGLATLAVAGLATLMITLAQPRVSNPQPLEIGLRINPNTASLMDLQLLPRIGPKLAESIAVYRDAVPAPAFRTAADLENVHRIGPVTAARLAPLVSFDIIHNESERRD